MKAKLLTLAALLFVASVALANPLPDPLYLLPVREEDQHEEDAAKDSLIFPVHLIRSWGAPLYEEKKETVMYRAQKNGNLLLNITKIPLTDTNYKSWWEIEKDSYTEWRDILSPYNPAFLFYDDCVSKGSYLYIVDYDCDSFTSPGQSYECDNYAEVDIAQDATRCSDVHETTTITGQEFLALKSETGYSEFCPGPEGDHLTLDFSGIVVGTEARETVMITNRSSKRYGTLHFWWEDQNDQNIESGEPFFIDIETGENPCINKETELMPGKSCNLNIVFSPTAQGSFNGRIVFGCFDDIRLQGSAIMPGEGADDDVLSTDKKDPGGCALSL